MTFKKNFPSKDGTRFQIPSGNTRHVRACGGTCLVALGTHNGGAVGRLAVEVYDAWRGNEKCPAGLYFGRAPHNSRVQGSSIGQGKFHSRHKIWGKGRRISKRGQIFEASQHPTCAAFLLSDKGRESSYLIYTTFT